MCPSVKVGLNQLKHTQTHTEGYAVIHTAIDKADGALEPLLSLFISVSISDTLVCFSTSFSVSLSPSLLSLYLTLHPYSSFLSLSALLLLLLLLLPSLPYRVTSPSLCLPRFPPLLLFSCQASVLYDYQLLVAGLALRSHVRREVF